MGASRPTLEPSPPSRGRRDELRLRRRRRLVHHHHPNVSFIRHHSRVANRIREVLGESTREDVHLDSAPVGPAPVVSPHVVDSLSTGHVVSSHVVVSLSTGHDAPMRPRPRARVSLARRAPHERARRDEVQVSPRLHQRPQPRRPLIHPPAGLHGVRRQAMLDLVRPEALRDVLGVETLVDEVADVDDGRVQLAPSRLRALRLEVPRGFGKADDDDVGAFAHRGSHDGVDQLARGRRRHDGDGLRRRSADAHRDARASRAVVDAERGDHAPRGSQRLELIVEELPVRAPAAPG
mmetsp:Transcript_3000/g.11784  ORF Transcript_3000/g.11784 Transcript_3000/m.11784 type:complete len:293 (-) Transcript_3000:195-1073(-)